MDTSQTTLVPVYLSVLVLVASVSSLFLYLAYRFCSPEGAFLPREVSEFPAKGGLTHKSVLVVFAHPDDEAMFMTPTLRALISKGWTVYFLCLTDGSGGGDGSVRAAELLASGDYFGVAPTHIEVVADPDLPDSMQAAWTTQLVAQYITRAVQRWCPGHVMTFDAFGVSGHVNHRAVHAGVAAWRKSHDEEHLTRPNVWALRSQPLYWKYLGPLVRLFPAPSASRTGAVVFHPPWCDIRCPFMAMRRHKSQLVWFRYLFVWFSSYTYENVWVPM